MKGCTAFLALERVARMWEGGVEGGSEVEEGEFGHGGGHCGVSCCWLDRRRSWGKWIVIRDIESFRCTGKLRYCCS